jgi:hypothetical protein
MVWLSVERCQGLFAVHEGGVEDDLAEVRDEAEHVRRYTHFAILARRFA